MATMAVAGAWADVPRKLLSKAEFNQAIARPLIARFDDMALGELLNALSEERRLAFLLDRRIDPTRHVSWRTNGELLIDAVADRLSATGASAKPIGSTIFVGPEDSVKKLRTVVALRMDELRDKGDAALKQRFAMLNDHSPAWQEATEPREVLADIARRWKLEIKGVESLPYDLWPAGFMHDVNAVEALSLVLIQFDRTFTWNDDASAVTIVPIPDQVFIERKHVLSKARQESLIEDVGDVLKSIDHTLEQDRLVVRASLEEHERLATLLGARPGKSTPTKVSGVPLKQRLFTLNAQQVRIRDAFQALREQGVTINYDVEAFEHAKVDLDQRVNLTLNKASAALFLSALCEPLGVEYVIDGVTVTLTLKK